MAIPTPDFMSFVPMYRPNPSNPIGDALSNIAARRQRQQQMEEAARANQAQEQLMGRRVAVDEQQEGRFAREHQAKILNEAAQLHRQGQTDRAKQVLTAAGVPVPAEWSAPAPTKPQGPPPLTGGVESAAPFAAPKPEEPTVKPDAQGVPTMEFTEPDPVREQPPAPEEPGSPPLVSGLGPGMVAAPQREAPVDPEVEAVVSVFRQMAERGDETARDIMSMAPGTVESYRRGGGGTAEAIQQLLAQHRMMRGQDLGYDKTVDAAKIRKGPRAGGGGGAVATPTWDRLDAKRRQQVWDRVRNVTKDTAAFAKVPAFRETLNTSRQLKQLLASGDPLADRAAFARILQQLFKGATSDRELGFLESAGGLENRVNTEWNKWVSEGRLPDDFVQSARALADQSISVSEDRLNRDGAALEDVVTGVVNVLEPGIDPGEIPGIARKFLLGASVPSAAGDDVPEGEEVVP